MTRNAELRALLLKLLEEARRDESDREWEEWSAGYRAEIDRLVPEEETIEVRGTDGKVKALLGLCICDVIWNPMCPAHRRYDCPEYRRSWDSLDPKKREGE